MSLIRSPLLLLLVVLAGLAASCGAVGTVDTVATAGLFAGVSQRVEAYESHQATPADPVLLDIQVVRQEIQQSPDRLEAARVALPIQHVCQVHDGYVTADPALTDIQRSTYLRSTQLLLALINEAAPAALPRPPTESRPGV